jgi:hypothetical protein
VFLLPVYASILGICKHLCIFVDGNAPDVESCMLHSMRHIGRSREWRWLINQVFGLVVLLILKYPMLARCDKSRSMSGWMIFVYAACVYWCVMAVLLTKFRPCKPVRSVVFTESDSQEAVSHTDTDISKKSKISKKE